MRLMNVISIIFVLSVTCWTTYGGNSKEPTVLIAILIRNKAHTLPYFLSFFEQLEYPKERIHLWIKSDNNVDNTIEILRTWLETSAKHYHAVHLNLDEESHGFMDENGIGDWSMQRFMHVINLREKALNYGRKIWADYIWMLDADVFLSNTYTLDELVSKNETIVAPLLKSDGMYSNFWAGMGKDYYYLRADRYEKILYQEETGCFEVPMVHSAVLIDLRKIASDKLTYDGKNLQNYNGPTDDIITFALAANISRTPMYICNDNVYGFVMVPLEDKESIEEDLQRLVNLKVEVLAHDTYLPLSENLQQFVTFPEADTLKLDNIYMINLLRRPGRRHRMQKLFKELGLHVEIIDAVDGRMLDDSVLNNWGVKTMPEYTDPYHKRPMTAGEIGCFLSHYVIWKKVAEDGYDDYRVMVLEDDVRFEPFFRRKLDYILAELEILEIKWDLIYLGRKKLLEKGETWVRGSNSLVHAAYSYWTLGYLLSTNGAKKLLNGKPLNKLVPVDEYLPILSDTHPREDWKVRFPKRDLIILSINPLLIHPTHYTGEQGYISDTEDSKVVTNVQKVNDLQGREEL